MDHDLTKIIFQLFLKCMSHRNKKTKLLLNEMIEMIMMNGLLTSLYSSSHYTTHIQYVTFVRHQILSSASNSIILFPLTTYNKY
jgi:hypothetical protein